MGVEDGLCVSQGSLNHRREWVRAAEHAPRDPLSVLERRDGFTPIVERGANVGVERPRVNRPPRVLRSILPFEI